MLGTRPGQFPAAERVAARTIALPFHTNLAESQVARVADVLRKAIA
jgi:perosamine synthetase